MKKVSLITFLVLFMFSAFGQNANKLNLDFNYCQLLGYKVIHEKTDSYVYLPDGLKVPTKKFYRGEIGTEYSYCAKKGYDLRIKKVPGEGNQRSYPVCVSYKDGKEIEINMLRVIYDNGDYGALFPNDPSPLEPPEAILRAPVPSPYIEPNPDLDEFCDYRDSSYFHDNIQNQGGCGNCYSYPCALVGEYAVTSALDLATSIDLSEMCITYCFSSCSNDIIGECNGIDLWVNNYYPYYMACENGVLEEIYWPNNNCIGQWDNNKRYVFNSYEAISDDYWEIQEAIAEYGPLAASVTLTDWSGYTSPNPPMNRIIYDVVNTCVNIKFLSVQHAVTIIGWGTDYTHGLYWIIANSAGLSWGDDGYGYVKANSSLICCQIHRLEYLPRTIDYNLTQSNYFIEGAPGSADSFWWDANHDSISNLPITTPSFVPQLTDPSYNGYHNVKCVVKYDATNCTPAYAEDTISKYIWVGKPTVPTIYGSSEIPQGTDKTYFVLISTDQGVDIYDWDIVSGPINFVGSDDQSSCTINAYNCGYATIKVTVTNQWGSNTAQKTIYVSCYSPMAYPNPTGEILTIDPNTDMSDIDKIEFTLLDNKNKKMKFKKCKGEIFTFNVADLPEGTYYLRSKLTKTNKSVLEHTQQIIILR